MSEGSLLSCQLRRAPCGPGTMLRILQCQITYVGGDHPDDAPVRMADFRECGNDQEATHANGCWGVKIGRRICIVLSHGGASVAIAVSLLTGTLGAFVLCF